MNSSVLSTQDSNGQKKKDSFTNKSKYDERYREKRNYTEYNRDDDARLKQMRREPSNKKRETSKENYVQVKDMRPSQSKEKNNWIKPTQKPSYMETRNFGT